MERPEWVFWHSFDPEVASFGLDGVVTEIGLSAFGPDFAQLDEAERTAAVEGFLRDQRALLIWDNFESVRSVPEPTMATPPLDDSGCQRLRDFLHRLAADGSSAVLVTSRSDEAWLDDSGTSGSSDSPMAYSLRRIQVGGLLPAEAAEFAEMLLKPYAAAAPRRSDRAFGELMNWLDGHPLSMRLVLPQLGSMDAETLLAGLRGTAPLPGWDDGPPGRGGSLRASLSYSFASLTVNVRSLLVAVCLFHGTADVDVLSLFSDQHHVPQRFRGVAREVWTRVLEAAADAGLLTRLGAGMYRIHPVLPAFLAAHWRGEEGSNYDAHRTAATLALLSAYIDFSDWLVRQIHYEDAEFAYTVISLHQRTMGHLLGCALDREQWKEAEGLAAPLALYWVGRSMYAEPDAWTDRVRLAVEDASGTVPSLDGPAGSLWLFFVNSQAIKQLTYGQFDTAAQTYGEILALLEAQPSSPERQERLAVILHQLGTAAQQLGRLDEADDWYARSLAVAEDIGARASIMATLLHLGTTQQDRGRMNEAKDLYTRSLAIAEELGDRPGIARIYHELGRVAQEQRRLDEAADCYVRSLAIKEELGDQLGVARAYDGLGMISLILGQLDQAEDWYARALAIHERLRNLPAMADSYHQLGLVAQARGRLDESSDWYVRCLTIRDEIGDRAGMVAIFYQLGMIAQTSERLDEADDWYGRSLTLAQQVGSHREMVSILQQLGLIAHARGRLDVAAGRYDQSLAITQEIDDRAGMARSYYLLGRVAQDKGRLNEVMDLYIRALAILEEFGDWASVELIYLQLGVLAEIQGNLNKALEWTVRSMTVASDVIHPESEAGLGQLAGLAHRLGMEALEVCWLRVTGLSLPEEIRNYVLTHA